MSSTARVDPAQVRSNTAPSRAAITGKVLMMTDMASTPNTEV